MTSKAMYAICIKSGAITNQIVGTSHEIVPGQLLKIISEKFKESYVIKLFDRDNKRFGKDLYKCGKEIIKELNDNDWAAISELKKGDNITVNLEKIPNSKINVNFCVISIGDIPSLGAGVFFALELVDNSLNADSKFIIRMKYYVQEVSAFCIRGDKLLGLLIINQTIEVQSFNSSTQKICQPPAPNNTNINYNPPQSNGSNSATYITSSSGQPLEESLIDFTDEISSKKIILEPPVISNVNQSVTGFEVNNLIDLQLQHLKNGLGDLRLLTEKEPNGMNEYARTNQFQFNIIDQDLQARNVNMLENRFDGSATYMRHPTPPSEQYYRGDNVRDFRASSNVTSNNIPAAILRKSQQNTEHASIPQSFTLIDLPPVDREEPFIVRESPTKNILNKIQQNNENLSVGTSFNRFEIPPYADGHICIEKYQNITGKPSMAVEPSENFLHQNSLQPPKNVNISKKSKPRSKYRRKNHNKKATKCYICHQLVVNIIELNCQHLCCSECLVSCLSNLEDAHCPFKMGSYKCNFKFEADDLASIFEAIENSLSEPGNNYTKILPKPKPFIVEPQSNVKKVEEELFEYNDNDSNEVLFYCKREKCEGCWFVDKTEGRNTYPCPLCDTYNCFKCQVIHDNITCEEYNRHNSVHRYNRENPPIEPTWKCEFCSFSGNLAETAICVVCSRTNDTIMQTKQINALEYYRLVELEENEDFVPNFDEFECVICTEMIEPDNGVQLRGCLHNICLVCIEKYIAVNDEPEIKCPFDGCTNILEDREIKRLVSPDVYARYLDISLRVGKTQIKNGYQCCVPNCEGFWIYSENTYAYNCPACRTENCISCKASHPSINCKTYQQNIFYSKDKNGIETRQKLEQMLVNGEAEHCPKCNIIVVKNGGCASMNCSMCKTHFTWGRKANKTLNIK